MAGKKEEAKAIIKFHTVLMGAGKTATGIHVPDEIVAQLSTSKKPPVRVTIKGHTYRSTIASMGGKYMVGVSADIRKITGVAAGDPLDVELELDTEVRSVEVPADFKKALSTAPAANKFFEGLSYSNKRRFILNIEDAKTPETRQRRIDKAVEMLKEGKV